MKNQTCSNIRTSIDELTYSNEPVISTKLSDIDIELIGGGMRCDRTGTAYTYDNDAGVCKSDSVWVCG